MSKKSVQWAAMSNDYPGCEYDEWGAQRVCLVDAPDGRTALEVAEQQYPDAHISYMLSRENGVYDNPNPKPNFAPYSWRETADAFIADHEAYEQAKAAEYAKRSWWDKTVADDIHDALDATFNAFDHVESGIDWVFGKIFGK